MSNPACCYHCGVHYPIEEMRRIMTKGGMRLRRIKTIKAVKTGIVQRDAFCRRMTEMNRAAAQVKQGMLDA